MRVLITGGSGFIGQALAGQLMAAGHEVTIVDRNPPRHVPDGVRLILLDFLEEHIRDDIIIDQDAVVHLMGINLFHRWTRRYKQRVYDSRVKTGQKLVEAIMGVDGRRRPRIFIGASAVGVYGNSGEKSVNETSPAGKDWLAKLCQDWEAIIAPFEGTSVRTVIIRTGVVLGPGGLLQKLKWFTKFYVGALIGSGRQRLSWISLPDILGIYQAAIENDNWTGPINAVAPKSVTLNELTKKLAVDLHRPRWLKLPVFVLRPFYGGFAKVMGYSQNVRPSKLITYHYEYKEPDFDDALKTALAIRGEDQVEAADNT